MESRQNITQFRTLEVGAQIREGPLADGRMDVFISEKNKSRRTRVFVCDPEAHWVPAEINMSILTKRTIMSSEQQDLARTSRTELLSPLSSSFYSECTTGYLCREMANG